MDVTTCLKSLLLAIRQYRTSRGALNASLLQKHMEDLSALKGCRILSSGQVLPSECLNGLLEVAGDPNTSPALTGCVLSLLAQLADDESKEALHSRYNIVGPLATIIHCNRATPEDPIVLQCLQVLQHLTYNVRLLHCASHIDDLLTFLMLNIQSQNDDITKPCLGLMANLCRHNQSVQMQIKSQSNVKAFYRALLNLLRHNCLTVVVFALSILSSLTLGEEVGQKLFNAKNIHQTFQLIFNITVNGDGTLTRNYAVDLLVDLLKNAKIADYLTNYKHLPVCLSEVVGLLHGKDPDTAVKVLELLVSLCSVPPLRRLICQTVLKPAAPRLQPAARNPAQVRGAEPGLALLQWATCPLQGPERCCLLALELFTELFEEVIGSSQSGSAHSFLELLLPALQSLLQTPDFSAADELLQRHCARAGRALDLLLVLCGDDFLKTLVAQHVSSELCVSLVELLLSNSHDYVTSICSDSSSRLSHVCCETVLKTLELMSQLKQHVADMETCFYRMLQDQRMVTPLSQALTSPHRERVHTALRVLFEAAPLPDFPAVILGESIAANNAYRQREGELSVRGSGVQEDGVAPAKSFAPPTAAPNSPSRQSIDSLIEKLQSGIQLQEQMKDVHMSEIIDVYEQKISALASKEGRLQDLLEAKALALSQADRLIAQYRCQRAQAEAEARKLASLLKDTERRKEELQAELSDQVMEVEKLKSDSQQLLQHNSRLQAVSDEHQNLKSTYNQLLSRYNKSEAMLKELQAAHISLTQQAESLRKSNEGLKLQQERLSTELQQKEEKISAMEAAMQEKHKTIAELQAEVRRQEEQAGEMEENVNMLKKELAKTEQARKDASIKASSLELQRSQLESKLQKKEEELNKHTQMIAMIHSLSSGKLKNDATANLSL
ncbi:protein CIP2A isoform X2 [Pangasianodon hypophthalmus]|uniref:protein CIP2A isoform X2 n=1 Tax=Pangasianodon hypophthalmus TaxID=310915 RepID=UPI002307BB15|nr:protein CIP2A isoform X2 [Pangasianodon hypophthalmus]